MLRVTLRKRSCSSAAMIGIQSHLNQDFQEERIHRSGPNWVESYLELAQAYEEAGADEVYLRAREGFPSSKQVSRESEAFRDGRGHLTERDAEDEYDEAEADSYSDESEDE